MSEQPKWSRARIWKWSLGLIAVLATSCALWASILGSQVNLLYQVASGGSGDLFRYSLLQDPSLRTPLGQNALHVAVAFRREEMLPPLLEAGTDINLQDKTGLTPLHVAAMHGRRTCAAWLLDHGAKLDTRDNFGDTPLHTAAIFGTRNIYQLLLDRGADPTLKNNDGRTPRDLAQHYGQHEILAFLDTLPAEAATQ